MQEEFETVVDPKILGGSATIMPEKTLSSEAIAALMAGPNQMGPGQFKKVDSAPAQPTNTLE